MKNNLKVVNMEVFIILFVFFSSVQSYEKCGNVASNKPIHRHPLLVSLENYQQGLKGAIRCGGTIVGRLFTTAFGSNVKEKCGNVASYNPIHQHPWLVSLEYYHQGLKGAIRCGGTLVSSRHIVTSAHCVKWNVMDIENITIIARLGEYNMASDRDCEYGVCNDGVLRIVVDHVYVHPAYYQKSVANDIAILVLEEEAPYTDFIRPVCINIGVPDNNTVFYSSGFGSTPDNNQYSMIKKYIPLKYYPNCEKVFVNLPKDVICAGGERRNFDTCGGDSGGPLVKMMERAELWGVIKAGGIPCGSEGKPGIYTNVPYHISWITEVMDRTNQNYPKDSGQTRAGVSVLILISFLLVN